MIGMNQMRELSYVEEEWFCIKPVEQSRHELCLAGLGWISLNEMMRQAALSLGKVS